VDDIDGYRVDWRLRRGCGLLVGDDKEVNILRANAKKDWQAMLASPDLYC